MKSIRLYTNLSWINYSNFRFWFKIDHVLALLPYVQGFCHLHENLRQKCLWLISECPSCKEHIEQLSCQNILLYKFCFSYLQASLFGNSNLVFLFILKNYKTKKGTILYIRHPGEPLKSIPALLVKFHMSKNNKFRAIKKFPYYYVT